MAKTPTLTEADLTAGEPRRRPREHALEIGGRRLSPSTLMMGHGFDPALSEGSLKPPVFLTSTYVFESAAHGKRFFEGVTGKPVGTIIRGHTVMRDGALAAKAVGRPIRFDSARWE